MTTTTHHETRIVARWMGPNSTQTRIIQWDARTRLTSTSLVDSFEGRDGFLASGMDVGVTEGYAKLDDPLARS